MLNKFIEKLRKKNNMTQEYLASQIGVSRPVYIHIEQGTRELTLNEAKILASIFDISLEDFTKGRETTRKIVLEKKPPKKDKIEIRVNHKNLEKFKQVFLYILEKVGAKPNVGETVVHKLLYFIDFDYYEKYEEQLIGAKYIKNHFGPTPVAFPEIIKQMEKDEDLIPFVKKYFQHDQKKYLPRRSADLSNFSAQEKELIDWEIERFKDFNASKMKEYSHQDVPWIGANDLQPINYEAVFCRTPEFSVRQYDDEI